MKRTFSSYYFVYFVAVAATQPFLSLYLHSKGISSQNIGFILACGNGAGILIQPFLGHVNDRVQDSRRLLLLSAILSPVIFFGYAITRSVALLLVVAVLFAVVQSAGPLADAMTVQEASRSGFTYGEIRLWGALSFALTTMITGYVYHRIGISWAFIIYAGLSVFLVFVTLQLPKERASTSSSDGFWKGLWEVSKNRRLLAFIVICFFVSSAITINFTYVPLYFQALHYPMGLVGLNFTIAALTEVPLFYVSGKWMTRFGKIPVLVLASAILAIKYVVMASAPPTAVIIPIQILDGVGYALYWSAAVQMVSELAPLDRNATAQTLYGAIAGSLSSIVGTSAGGWVLAHFGPVLLYLVNASTVLIACIGFIGFSRFGWRRRLSTPPASK